MMPAAVRRAAKAVLGERTARLLRDTSDLARFRLVTGLRGYQVPDQPFFDEGGLRRFTTLIEESERYLEYGTGGSTMAAAAHVDMMISVENDSGFLRAVEEKLRTLPRRPGYVRMLPIDIGVSGEWGKPYIKTATLSRIAKWRHYPEAPWGYFSAAGAEPDTILVDGRFRVACALYSLLRLKPGSPCRILFDDYGDRPEYGEVAHHAALVSMDGRMAVFRKSAEFDAARCARAYEVASGDWR